MQQTLDFDLGLQVFHFIVIIPVKSYLHVSFSPGFFFWVMKVCDQKNAKGIGKLSQDWM